MPSPALFSVVGGLVGAVVGGAVGAGLGIGLGKRKPAAAGGPRLSIVLGAGLAVIGALGGAVALRAMAGDALDRTNPTLAVLHRYYPAQYRQVVEATAAHPGDPIATRNAVGPAIAGLLRAHARQIDDASARRMFTLVVSEARILHDRAPGACIAMLSGGGAQVNVAALMTPQMRKADDDNTAAVLEQVATRPAAPATPMDRGQAGALAVEALRRLPTDQRMVANMLLSEHRRPATASEAQVVCGFEINLFQAALDGPPSQIRALLSVG
jgi:hypothetical protein